MIKVLRLSRADIAYKLALEDADYDPNRINLDSFYSGLLSVKKPRDRYFVYYATSVIFLLFVHLGGIKEAELLGMKPTQGVTQLSALLLTSCMSLFYSYYQGKVVRFDHIFAAIAQRSSHARNQTLLLKYPEAYNALQFSYYIVGRPKHLFPKRAIPIRLIILGLVLIPAFFGIFTLWIWLLWSVSYQLWFSESEIGTFWVRILVLTSWLIILASMTVPTADTIKRTYLHYGMTNILAVVQRNRPDRHRKFLGAIGAIQERMRNSAKSKR